MPGWIDEVCCACCPDHPDICKSYRPWSLWKHRTIGELFNLKAWRERREFIRIIHANHNN